MEKTRRRTALFALTLITQVASTYGSTGEALALLNKLRGDVPGNENIVPLSEYPNFASKDWQIVKIFPKTPQESLREGIERFHRIFTNSQAPHSFTQIIEITRSDKTKRSYKMGRGVASGSQGFVTLGCTTNGSEKVVAVKLTPLIYDADLADATLEANFYKEMDGQIDAAPVLIDCGTLEKNNVIYFVTVLDFIDVDIYDLLTFCGGKFSLETSVTLVRQLLKNAKEFHDIGIVHRDLKPENVMFNLPTKASLLKMRVVDFGHADHYPRNPSERVNVTNYRKRGTPDTMSTFTHNGNAPHPRDDLLSIWYILAIFIDGWVPWDILLAQLRDPATTNEQIVELINLIRDKKEETSLMLLVSKYPELKDFISHIMNLKMEDNPNYVLLDKCLENVINVHVKNKNWKYDWEVKGDLLFRNANLINISFVHDKNEGSYVLKLEPFYAAILAEIRQYGKIIQVLDELDVEAKNQIGLDQLPVGTYYANEIALPVLQELSLGLFLNWEYEALNGEGALFVGFSYHCEDSVCRVVMVLKGNQEVWKTLHSFKIPVPKHEGIWETEKMNSIGNFINNPVPERPIDATRYLCSRVDLHYIPSNPLAALENLPFHKFNHMIQRKEIAEMGFKLNTVEAVGGYMQNILLVFRKSFDFAEYASHAGIDSERNFSWSVDESNMVYSNPNFLPDPKIVQNKADKEQQEFIVPNAKIEAAWKILVKASNWKMARNLAMQEYLAIKELDKEMLNVRVQWERENESYNFTFIQDEFYKAFLTGKNPPNFEFGANWLLDTRITEGDYTLRQLANTIAGEMPVQRRLEIEHRNGLVILSTTLEMKGFVPQAMNVLMSKLRSETARKEAGICPEMIGSAAFGYAISCEYIYGVAIFEPLGNTLLKLVSENRLQQNVPQLSLSDQNDEWAMDKMREYNKKGLFSRSGNLLRSSAKLFKQEKDTGSVDGGLADSSSSSAKGKDALKSSSGSFRLLSRSLEKMKSFRSTSSNNLLVDHGEQGVYKLPLPSDGLSIQDTILNFWKNNLRNNQFLSSGDFKSISITVFTGSETTKIVYQLHTGMDRDLNQRRIQI